MSTSTVTHAPRAYHAVPLAEKACNECQVLELTRSSWIQCYMDLLKQRKLFLQDGKLPGRDLSESLAQAESELKEVWKRLVEHGASHSSAA